MSRLGSIGSKSSGGTSTLGFFVRVLYTLKNTQKMTVMVVNMATLTSLGAGGFLIGF